MHLLMGVEHAAKAALRADIQPLIGKGWHDLNWWQCGVLGLVAGEQDSLSLLFTESVGNQTGAVFRAIVAATITDAGLPPALEGVQRDPDLTAGTRQTRDSRMRLADEFGRFFPVSSAAQPSASSEQKASDFFSQPQQGRHLSHGLLFALKIFS
jgi:hypothetical protein